MNSEYASLQFDSLVVAGCADGDSLSEKHLKLPPESTG